ncbi:MAG: hypothetical protein WEC84_02950 [Candidatus Andersenbacteria bacterium]
MTAKSRPFFIIESLDAGGGSTQLEFLARRLTAEGYTPNQYHFPQEDAPTGQLIYQKYLHDRNKHPLSRREQSLLYMQDFFSKLEEMQRIAGERSKDILISDRYCTSTMAYQTIGLTGKRRQDMLAWLRWLAWEGSPQLLKPTAVLLLDIPVSLAIQRLNKSGKKKDLYEHRDKLMAIRKSYMRLAREQKWLIVSNTDSTGQERTRQDIHDEVWGHIAPRI